MICRLQTDTPEFSVFAMLADPLTCLYEFLKTRGL